MSADRFKSRVWNPVTHVMITDDDNLWTHMDGELSSPAYSKGQLTHLVKLQCTGLKDKHGTLIFCGDILKSDIIRPELHEVAFRDGAYVLLERYEDPFHLDLYRTQYSSKGCHCEIIGNVHQQPYLIGGGS